MEEVFFTVSETAQILQVLPGISICFLCRFTNISGKKACFASLLAEAFKKFIQ
jgi:hypothetical protein